MQLPREWSSYFKVGLLQQELSCQDSLKFLVRCCYSVWSWTFQKLIQINLHFFLSYIVWALLVAHHRWTKMRSNALRVGLRGTKLYPKPLAELLGQGFPTISQVSSYEPFPVVMSNTIKLHRSHSLPVLGFLGALYCINSHLLKSF